MTSSALTALENLQQRARRATDIYDIERLDRALDEIVDNLHRADPAPFQSRNALANASKVIRKRRTIRHFHSLNVPRSDGNPRDVGALDGGFDEVDLHQWLDTTPSLRPTERQLLRDLADGEHAESLAQRHGASVARMREQISRVRAAGRAAYQREVPL